MDLKTNYLLKKTYHNHRASDTTVPIKPFKNNMANWFWFGNSNFSIFVKFKMKNIGHIKSKFHKPTNPRKDNLKIYLNKQYLRS